MLLQVSTPGNMNVFSLSFILWLTVIISVTIVAVFYFLKNYHKTFLWAHQVIHPFQDGLHKWNKQLNGWWQHTRGLNFFQRMNNSGSNNNFHKSTSIIDDSYADEVIDIIFSDRKDNSDAEVMDQLTNENKRLQQENDRLRKELHIATAYNHQLQLEIKELKQYRQLNQQLSERINTLQAELTNINSKWSNASLHLGRLNEDLNTLSGVEKEWIDAVNLAKDLERQVQQIPILEAEIKSLGAEKEWLHIQLQQIKTSQLHEFETLQENYNTLVEERQQLQDKIVLLESEVGALSRALNNNKQQLNEDVLWESKYITAAKELNRMRRQYAGMEDELSMLRNKEQLLREKAKLTDGLITKLQTRELEIASLQRQLYECRKK